MYSIWERAEKVFPLRRIWQGFYWCKTYTPFEKELRRYFHWEESEKVSTDVEHILHLRRSWEGISIWEGWIFSNILIWEGIEKVFLLRRTWEAWNYYRVVEMDLRRWDGSEKEMYPPGFIGQKILKLWRQERRPFGPNPAQISIPVP